MSTGGESAAVSSIEKYRKGDLKDPEYDMGDPLDVAIFAALQAYVDLLERLDLARPRDKREANLYEYQDTSNLNLRQPGFLEAELRRLKRWNRGEEVLEPEDRIEPARLLLEAFFSPARNLTGKLVPWGYGEYHVDRPLWEAGEEMLEGKREAEDGNGLLGLSQWDAAHHFRMLLAPLYAMLIRSLDGLITQAEVARRLDLTPRGVALRISRGEMRQVRVGGTVLIPEADVRDAGGKRSRTVGLGT